MSRTTSDWDARYADTAEVGRAAEVLSRNLHLLPRRGRALDLACGLGGNALVLARCGLETEAWDWSAAALKLVAQQAVDLDVHTQVRDVERDPPPPASFDVIVVSLFLERSLAPALVEALRPGGLLFYQTFAEAVSGRAGPGNPAFRLRRGEMLQLFAPLQTLYYREESDAGALALGCRDQALFVGRKSHPE